MPRYRLQLEYDGTDFCGWQRQPNGVAVQQVVEEAILALSDQKVTLTAAGRTDAGVHSVGQVAHFDCSKSFVRPKEAINFHLRKLRPKADVAVVRASQAPSQFDARFSATHRYYRYFILQRQASPLLQNRAWQQVRKLNHRKMNSACGVLMGRHDFSAFRGSGDATSPIKTLDYLRVHKKGEFIVITALAKSFLYKQVRMLTAALVEVGKNKLTLKQLEQIRNRKKNQCGTAPPHGLYLWRVGY